MTETPDAGSDLDVSRQDRGGWVALVVRGDLTGGTVPLLRSVLDGVDTRTSPRVEIDLTGVRRVDAEGVQTLVEARRRLASCAKLRVLVGEGPYSGMLGAGAVEENGWRDHRMRAAGS